jgi:hypothetical protein
MPHDFAKGPGAAARVGAPTVSPLVLFITLPVSSRTTFERLAAVARGAAK